jgi:hypothetical protein
MKTSEAYQKIVNVLKRRKKGSTAADVSAAAALPLATVRELLPKAADEYSARLQVTQSGEILYHFPDGFTSRYRGLKAAIKKIAAKSAVVIKAALVFLFKAWIMIMLIGYFALFLALALASVFVSLSAKSSGRGGRRDGFFGFSAFDLLWRFWFYSQLTRPRRGYGNVTRKEEQKRPMHKAIFSFIFGEDDPNKNWEDTKNKSIIAYIQANRGVISLAEYMAFTGENSAEAEESILSFCSKFAGSPEVTDEGTIVYRFDDLLLRANTQDFAELSPPVKRLKKFSANSKKMNGWFIVINAVNLIFGSYFLYNSFAAGLLVSQLQYQLASRLYAFTHIFLEIFTSDPVSIIRVVLGLIPLLFSVLFWLVPVVRHFLESKENEDIKLGNFKRLGFSKIWSSPKNIEINSFNAPSAECRPKNFAAAGDRVVKDIGAISSPEIKIDENGKTTYSFLELEREKHALEKYRAGLDPARAQLGKTVFDSGK